jgi:hypothetical protein
MFMAASTIHTAISTCRLPPFQSFRIEIIKKSSRQIVMVSAKGLEMLVINRAGNSSCISNKLIFKRGRKNITTQTDRVITVNLFSFFNPGDLIILLKMKARTDNTITCIIK